jgi:hypothetical protein
VSEQLSLLAPVHRNDPASSREAAARVNAGSQLAAVLAALSSVPDASNRDLQVMVCGGFNPGHPSWNKIATRTRTLERRGLIELVTDAGEPVLREHPSGGRFLVWRAI